jgi:hypothetical protein
VFSETHNGAADIKQTVPAARIESGIRIHYYVCAPRIFIPPIQNRTALYNFIGDATLIAHTILSS